MHGGGTAETVWPRRDAGAVPGGRTASRLPKLGAGIALALRRARLRSARPPLLRAERRRAA